MKNIYVKDIRADSDVCDYFLVKQKSLNKSKTDKYYLALKLCDKTGEIDTRMWDNAEHFNSLFDVGDVVVIRKGSASIYQKKIQISASSIEKIDKSSVDLGDYIEATEFDRDAMFNELKSIIKGVRQPFLKKLLDSFFDDDYFVDAFCESTAAKALHHAYIGGLLEHTLSVAKLIKLLVQNYPELNEDMMVTGAILHDIGKLKEISTGVGFEYTDSGRLLGHIVMGTIMIQDKIDGIDGFPEKLADLLKHIILSHHGIYEYGSPKRPKTLEAYVVSAADDLDAKISMMKKAISRDLGDGESGWTNYNSLFERYLFKEPADFSVPKEPEDVPGEAGSEEPKQPAKKEPENTNQFSMFGDEG